MRYEEGFSNRQIHSMTFSCFLVVLTLSLLFTQYVHAIPESNVLKIPYHTQETDYYCGPTSVQMILEYITGNVTAQAVLAEEMGTTAANKGTDTNMVRSPFVKRGYLAVRERNRATINELKELNAQGYASVINIHFDTDHKSGHYIVVMGYNETGIFVNDPWPIRWKQPVSRRTGNNTYLSNVLLADLWVRHSQWILEIPYKPNM